MPGPPDSTANFISGPNYPTILIRLSHIKVDYVGFDEGESSWEQHSTVWDGSPQFVKSELRKLRIDREVRSRVHKYYGITL